MACDDLITNQDLENAKKDATTMSDFVESDSPEIQSKNGKNIRTLQGINDAADNLISSLGGTDIGDYEDDLTLNSYNEYVVFDRAGSTTGPSLWKAIPPRTPAPGTPLPYTIDSAAYPDPTSDPNIEPFSDINKAGAEQISDDFDNNRQKETTGLSDITEVSAGDDLFPLIGQGIRVAGVGLWVVPSVTADGSPMPNPAILDFLPVNSNATVNGGVEVTLIKNTSRVDYVFSSVNDMKMGHGLYPVDLDGNDFYAETESYYKPGEYDRVIGGSRYKLTTITRYRDEISDPSWIPDGLGDHYLFGGANYVSVLIGQITIWNYGAKPFLNDGNNTGEDSTLEVQTAIYAAKGNDLLDTHTISKLKPVFADGADFLISGEIYIPEGVIIDGVDKISGRMVLGWTSGTVKVSPYGKKYDIDQGNPRGTTFTKNFGLKNISLVPHYVETGPASATYLDSIFTIEMITHEVRFILQKGAVGGGQLNATAISFEKTIDWDFNNVTFDGGRNHIYCEPGVTPWGLNNTRGVKAYSFNALSDSCRIEGDDNKIDLIVQMPDQVGSNRALLIESGSGNNIDIKAFGAQLRYGAIIDGVSNYVEVDSNGASIFDIEIRGSDNSVKSESSTVNIDDAGSNSRINIRDYFKNAGVAYGVKRGVSVTTSSVDVAEIELTTAVASAAIFECSTSFEVAGIGRGTSNQRWFIEQNTSNVVTATKDSGTEFLSGAPITLNVTPTGPSTARLAILVPSGSGTADVAWSLTSDSNAKVGNI